MISGPKHAEAQPGPPKRLQPEPVSRLEATGCRQHPRSRQPLPRRLSENGPVCEARQGLGKVAGRSRMGAGTVGRLAGYVHVLAVGPKQVGSAGPGLVAEG